MPILEGMIGEVNELGLWIPKGTRPSRRRAEPPPALRDTGTYVTLGELTALAGRQVVLDEGELIERLRLLSAADCMAVIADLSARIAVAPNPYVSEVQRELARRIGGQSGLTEALDLLLKRGRPTVVVCEQQLVHLARLVILHADSRAPDNFGDGQRYERWIDCLFGVNDLLDGDLVASDPRSRLSWELRQCGINHSEDELPVLALHHEIYREILPEVDPEGAAQLEAAFKEHTGLTMSDYFVVGAAVQARFMSAAQSEGGMALMPEKYFSSVKLERDRWVPFFELTGRDQAGLGEALREEEKRYGSTTYGSLTFERFPLFEGVPGAYLPISMNSLQRRITNGVFHLLAEAAEVRGRDRRLWTSKFGMPFQTAVERTLRRGLARSTPQAAVAADAPYVDDDGQEQRSTDVMLGFGNQAIFVEVVSGPLRAATLTRGSLEDFEADMDRLVIGKARQLERSISNFLNGSLQLKGIDAQSVRRVWPVIVTAEAFPYREEINHAVDAALREEKLLHDKRIGDLAIISAEELFFCEGFMEEGESLLALIQGWKSSPAAPHSFKNFLIAHGGGKAPGSEHLKMGFGKAAAEQHRVLFGSKKSGEEVHAELLRRSGRNE